MRYPVHDLVRWVRYIRTCAARVLPRLLYANRTRYGSARNLSCDLELGAGGLCFVPWRNFISVPRVYSDGDDDLVVGFSFLFSCLVFSDLGCLELL